MMQYKKQLSIILCSFRDPRIVEAIASIRAFDDIGTVKIVLIDGGSDNDLLDQIRPLLTSDDILLSEPDNGIFDGLNKGIDRVDTEYMGWIGSDDLFTGEVLASEVIAELIEADVFVGSLMVFRGQDIRRITSSWPSAKGLVPFGLHNPHYSTFGRSGLFKKYRFEEKNISADIEYFVKIFRERPKVAISKKIVTLMAEGGYSTQNLSKSFAVNKSVFHIYTKYHSRIIAFISVLIKVGYKSLSAIKYRLLRKQWTNLFPISDKLADSKSAKRG